MSPIRAMEWAIAMGILHHLVFQFPQQAPIFSTLFGFLIENISVYLALTWDTNTLSGLGIAQQLALFNAVEVDSLCVRLTLVHRYTSFKSHLQCLLSSSRDSNSILVGRHRFGILARLRQWPRPHPGRSPPQTNRYPILTSLIQGTSSGSNQTTSVSVPLRQWKRFTVSVPRRAREKCMKLSCDIHPLLHLHCLARRGSHLTMLIQ